MEKPKITTLKELKKNNYQPNNIQEELAKNLKQFVQEFTMANSGKAFYTGLNNLGEMIFEDYEKNRKKRFG